MSLDTLDPQKFQRITQRGDLTRVLAGISAAQDAGFNPVKINAVIERGVNDADIPDLVRFCRERGLILRLIEFMDGGNANQWTSKRLVPKSEMLDQIRRAFPVREKNLLGQDRIRPDLPDLSGLDTFYSYGDGHMNADGINRDLLSSLRDRQFDLVLVPSHRYSLSARKSYGRRLRLRPGEAHGPGRIRPDFSSALLGGHRPVLPGLEERLDGSV